MALTWRRIAEMSSVVDGYRLYGVARTAPRRAFCPVLFDRGNTRLSGGTCSRWPSDSQNRQAIDLDHRPIETGL